ncbi:ROK family transcriptional regulator [Granulosicoccaceae sp. 1_MG-2023]|nr:ROK family transcriptional regulator [Granulosicoccaceae sp. 1_MG-2023]
MPFLKTSSAESQRELNRTTIMRLLRQHGRLARVELGVLAGLSPATVTAITRKLLSEQLIREVDEGPADEAGRGRPRVRLEVNGQAGYLLILVIRSGQGRWSLVDFAGHVLEQTPASIASGDRAGQQLTEGLCADITRLLGFHGLPTQRLLGIGICLHGLLDCAEGRVLWSPALELHNVAVAGPLREAFKCPVSLVSEADAITLAVSGLPDCRNLREFACLHLGEDGIGMGLVLAGALYNNRYGFAGEFGHLKYPLAQHLRCRCGADGCIETLVSGWALRRDLGDKLPDAACPEQGDKAAREWFERAGRVIGTGIGHVINLLAPERVILCGPLAEYFRWFSPPMRDELRRQVLKPEKAGTAVTALSLPDECTVRGAIAYTLSGGHAARTQAALR